MEGGRESLGQHIDCPISIVPLPHVRVYLYQPGPLCQWLGGFGYLSAFLPPPSPVGPLLCATDAQWAAKEEVAATNILAEWPPQPRPQPEAKLERFGGAVAML